jgi:hypothetical protein
MPKHGIASFLGFGEHIEGRTADLDCPTALIKRPP